MIFLISASGVAGIIGKSYHTSWFFFPLNLPLPSNNNNSYLVEMFEMNRT
jgi:hypothetical protein